MSDRYEKYRDKAFTADIWYLLKNALDEDIDITGIADERYDIDQVRLLLDARKRGIDISPVLDPELPAEKMEKIIDHIAGEMGTFEEHYENVKRKWLKNTTWIAALCTAATIITSLLIIYRDDIGRYFQDLQLSVNATTIEIEAGDVWDPYDNIAAYNDDAILEVEGAEEVDTTQPGTYDVIYHLSNGKKERETQVIIKVIDTKPPTIELKQKKLTITEGEEINPSRYIAKAYDTVDGDLKSEVSYKWDGSKKVIYSVKDSSGNTATEELSVSYQEKPQVAPAPSTTQKEPSTSGDDTTVSKPSAPTSKPSKTAKDQRFPLEEGKTFDDASKACTIAGKAALNNGTASGYDCIPYYDGNGIAKGFDLIFR